MTAPTAPLPVVVLISGSGSNLQALIDSAGEQHFRIHGVISNRPQAGGLARATAAGIATRVVDHKDYPDRAAFDAALAGAVDAFDPALVVLAGFMRILTTAFVNRYAGRMINIHPSLLPDFQGLDTHSRALAAGVGEHGASVHFVTAELDGGPVIAQTRVAVEPGDDATRLAARVLRREHALLPQVVGWFARNRVELRDGKVWMDGKRLQAPLQC
ncbi:MAG: phosphoribosylglycinamide formyltransferase [Gammaproteobacteria bacterium]|nr:phosphoribosylglycinamide formyltransferase [Gammaproteobacteria bacterium]